MEKRLTAQGPKDRKSYTVTLPIEWVKREHLDRSRKVELDMIGHKIIISPSQEGKSSITLDGEAHFDGMIKVLQGVYRAGVDEVRIEYEASKTLKKASDIIEGKLIGYEIIEQGRGHMLIKDITKESEEDFMIIFRRIFLLILELAESRDIIQAEAIDRNIKKLINYCQRILMKRGHAEFTKTPLYYLILDRLEKLKDEYRWLMELPIRRKKTLQKLNGLLRIAYEQFYRYDTITFEKNLDLTHRMRNSIKIGDNIDKESIHLHNIARILNSLYGDIFTLGCR